MLINPSTNILTNETGKNGLFEALQFSAKDINGSDSLYVILKKTFSLTGNANKDKPVSPVPLKLDFEFKDGSDEILISDIDVYSNKPFTDVVIRGHAHSKNPVNKLQVMV